MSGPRPRGYVEIDPEECRGCGLCVLACPVGCLYVSEAPNRRGYNPIRFSGGDCRGDGLCLSACPNPGAIRVFTVHAGGRAGV